MKMLQAKNRFLYVVLIGGIFACDYIKAETEIKFIDSVIGGYHNSVKARTVEGFLKRFERGPRYPRDSIVSNCTMETPYYAHGLLLDFSVHCDHTSGKDGITVNRHALNGSGLVKYCTQSNYHNCTIDPGEDDGNSCSAVGNPCNPATGKKYQAELDFSSNKLKFQRHYSSQVLISEGLGVGWRHNFQKELRVRDNTITVISSSGRGERWLKINNVWQGDVDSPYLLEEHLDGFNITNKNSSSEKYDMSGRILSELDVNGYEVNYEYDDSGRLIKVINNYGNHITLHYDDYGLRLRSVVDQGSHIYRYNYDNRDNLIEVLYPDGTPTDDTDNPRKTYHYENVYFPYHLTGITDENGDRYATYAYDGYGKAISTEHAQTTNTVGQEQFQLDYQGTN